MDTDTNRGFENLTLDDIEQYNYRYGKAGSGFSVEGALTKEGFSTVMSGLEPGAAYRVDVRVKYSNLRYSEWRTAEGHVANRPPRLATGRLNPTYILEWGGKDRVERIDNDFTDPDPHGDELTYSVSSSPAGIVTATIEDGEENGTAIKNLRIRLLNPITGAANVTYGAHDPYGGYVFQVISVGGISNMTREVAENSPAGTAVGEPVRGMPHGTEALFYTLTGEAATSGLFVIDSATGQISVAEGATLDHEGKSSYTGKVAWTVNGQAAEVNLTIKVTNVDEPPLAPVNPRVTDIAATRIEVEWDAPDNSGRPAITEYELQAEHPDSTVTTNKTPNGATHSIRIRRLDPGTTYDLTLKARNADGDGAPTTLTATTLDPRPRSADFTKYFREGENANFSRSDFPFSSDQEGDALGKVRLTSLPAASEGAFKLKQSSGRLSDVAVNTAIPDLRNLVFVAAASFDGTATAQFKVIDRQSQESQYAYTLTLRQVANIPPSFAEAGPLHREIPENTAGGTAIGDPVTATDPDTGDMLVYSLSGTDAGSFTINRVSGQISVAAGTVLDYETKVEYEVQVRRQRRQGRRRERRRLGRRDHYGGHRGAQRERRGAARRGLHPLGGYGHHDEGDRDPARHHRHVAHRLLRGGVQGRQRLHHDRIRGREGLRRVSIPTGRHNGDSDRPDSRDHLLRQGIGFQPGQ